MYYDKLDSKRFREIDHKLNFDEIRQGWTFKYHSYQPLFPKYSTDFAEFRDLFDGKDQTIRYKAIGTKVEGTLINTDDTNPNFDDNEDNKAVLYKDVFGKGGDYILYNTRSSMVKVATVNNPNEAKEDAIFEWEVELPKEGVKELSVYRAETKEKLVTELKSKFTTAYKLDTTKEKVFDTDKMTLIGNNKDDGKEWYTYLRGYKAWDSEDTITVEAKLYRKDNKLILRKTIPLTFLQKAKGRVFTDTTTSYYAGAGDGWIRERGNSTWTASHDVSSGDYQSYTGTNGWGGVGYDSNSNVLFLVQRGYFPVDTSSLSVGVTISGATFNIYTSILSNEDNDGDDWVNIVQTTTASNTALATSDFSKCGTTNDPTEGATRISLANFNNTAYTGWTLNSTGLGWISKTGYTKLGMREGHDALNNSILKVSTTYNTFLFQTSEQTDTSQDPYLSVTYSTGYSGDWTSSEMSIDNTKVSGSADLTDFPVLIKDGNLADAVYSGVTMDTGKPKDLRFSTDSAGSTKLNFEVVSFDASAKTCEIWLKIPTLGYNADTTIYAWYGNSSATYPDADDADEGSEGVWNSNYDAVYHMSGDPSGSAPQVLDSTSNDNDLTSVGTMTSGDLVTGALGAESAIEFDGTDDYFKKSSPTFNYTTEDFTIQVLLKSTSAGFIGGANQTLISHGGYKNSGFDWNPKGDKLSYEISQSGARQQIVDDGLITKETWTHTAFTKNGSVGKLYKDGSEVSYALQQSLTDPASSSLDFTLMSLSGGGNYTAGFIDEVRISQTELSADWIATEYTNQNAPSTFWTADAPPATEDDTNFFGVNF